MTLSETIKKYDLHKKTTAKGYDCYTGEKETTEARFLYRLDNQFSRDLDDGKTYYLTVERYSKTATVWSDLFGAFIPRKTIKVYTVTQ